MYDENIYKFIYCNYNKSSNIVLWILQKLLQINNNNNNNKYKHG